VPPLKSDDLIDFNPDNQVSSFEVRRKVLRAWKAQQERFDHSGKFNAQMSSKEIQKHCILAKQAKCLLEYAAMELNLTGRTYDHILRVSRTIADLDMFEEIEDEHIAEAIQYRTSQQTILEMATG
jgi:magnesium chelatase family protein